MLELDGGKNMHIIRRQNIFHLGKTNIEKFVVLLYELLFFVFFSFTRSKFLMKRNLNFLVY